MNPRSGSLGGSTLAAVLLLASLTPLAMSATADAGTCPDVWYVGARGSGESATGHHGMGPAVDVMSNPVAARANELGLKFARFAVDYPADGVAQDAKPSKGQIALFVTGQVPAALYAYKTHNVDKYLGSLNQGTAAVKTAVRTILSNCPDSQIVLAGYSQGAMAVHDAESDMKADGDKRLDHVVGTLLLGDGDRVAHSGAKLFGTSDNAAEGIRTSLNMRRNRDVPKPGSTANICNTKDIICDFSPKYVFNHAAAAMAVHTEYDDKGVVQPILIRAATWVAGKIQGRPAAGDAPTWGGDVHPVTWTWRDNQGFLIHAVLPTGTVYDHARGEQYTVLQGATFGVGTNPSDKASCAICGSGGEGYNPVMGGSAGATGAHALPRHPVMSIGDSRWGQVYCFTLVAVYVQGATADGGKRSGFAPTKCFTNSGGVAATRQVNWSSFYEQYPPWVAPQE